MIRLLLEGWALCAAIQALLWLIAQRTKNAGIVDVGWALTFTAVVALFGASTGRWPPVAAVVVLWSLRLGGYLIARGAATGPEEGRYADLRARWAPHASAKFFVFFQAQAALTAVLASAFVVPFVRAPGTPWLCWVGLALSAMGVIGETLADAQLARFKRKHKGQVCDVGLWSWSRHPNYFFEWCVWLGYAVAGFAYAPIGLVALAPQAIILGSIFGVTGIPPTENQAIRSKGDAYRAYQKRVSKFVPLPPKSRGNDA
jgi:steroid 5-alpha reductase family enzyme